jgi:hypothetical protein
VNRIRQSAQTGKARGRKPAGPAAGGPVGRAAISPSQQLDYIADMVQELKMMSAQADCRTLAGLLELAYQEALRRRRKGA